MCHAKSSLLGGPLPADVRRAIGPAITLREHLKKEYPTYGRRFLLENLWQTHHLGRATYGALAAQVNANLEEVLRRELLGEEDGRLWAWAFLEGLRQQGVRLNQLEREHQRLLDTVKAGRSVAWMTATRIREALHAWERGKSHREWLEWMRRLEYKS